MGISKQFIEQGADGKVLLCTQEWRERALFVVGVFFFKGLLLSP